MAAKSLLMQTINDIATIDESKQMEALNQLGTAAGVKGDIKGDNTVIKKLHDVKDLLDTILNEGTKPGGTGPTRPTIPGTPGQDGHLPNDHLL